MYNDFYFYFEVGNFHFRVHQLLFFQTPLIDDKTFLWDCNCIPFRTETKCWNDEC